MAHPQRKLRWHNDFKINIPTIDAQHKQLFNTYTDLNLALQQGLKATDVEKALNRLQLYVTRHFLMEEKFMRESSYPHIDEQITAHQYFSRRFSEILQEFKRDGLTPAIVKSMQTELGEWLQHHVSGLDMSFGRYYNSR